jgi:hypothetical protein
MPEADKAHRYNIVAGRGQSPDNRSGEILVGQPGSVHTGT